MREQKKKIEIIEYKRELKRKQVEEQKVEMYEHADEDY